MSKIADFHFATVERDNPISLLRAFRPKRSEPHMRHFTMRVFRVQVVRYDDPFIHIRFLLFEADKLTWLHVFLPDEMEY
jgi:hypothetical protein